MTGMSRTTGQALDGIDHLRQSIADIIFTPVGTRIARREYGSLLPELLDHPDNGATRVRLFAATAGALMRWEPRLRISRVSIEREGTPGQLTVGLEGLYIPEAGPTQVLSVRVPLQLRAAV